MDAEEDNFELIDKIEKVEEVLEMMKLHMTTDPKFDPIKLAK
jgi:hypothetical protein